MTVRLTAVCAFAALGLAACGSSSSSSGPSPASYRASVNKICAASNSEVEALPASDNNDVTGLEKQFKIESGTITRFEAVTPPSSLKAKVDKLTSGLNRDKVLAAALLADLKAGDRTKAISEGTKAQALSKQTTGLSRELGLAQCAVDATAKGA